MRPRKVILYVSVSEKDQSVMKFMLEGNDTIMRLSEIEYSLVRKMKNASFCSTKQLFWLRDIKDRVL